MRPAAGRSGLHPQPVAFMVPGDSSDSGMLRSAVYQSGYRRTYAESLSASRRYARGASPSVGSYCHP